MPLDLTPEIETVVRQYADREGMSLEALLSRAFPPLTAPPEPAALVPALLQQWQQDYGLPTRPDGQPHTSVEELFAQWDKEDAVLTLEEASAEQRLWEDRQTQMSMAGGAFDWLADEPDVYDDTCGEAILRR